MEIKSNEYMYLGRAINKQNVPTEHKHSIP